MQEFVTGMYFESVRYLDTFQLEDRFGPRAQTWKRWASSGKLDGARLFFGRWMVPEKTAAARMAAERAAHPDWTPIKDRSPRRRKGFTNVNSGRRA